MTRLIEITGKALSGEWGKDDDSGNGIPVLRTTNFTNIGEVDYENVVTRNIIKKNLDEKYLRKGDIIIEKSGGSDKQPVGRVIFFDGEERTYLFNNFTGLLRVKDQANWYPRYIFYSLFSNYRKGGTRAFENKTTGLHNLKTDEYVAHYEVADASMQNQIAICAQLDRVTKNIKLHQQELQKLDQLIKSRFVEMFGDPLFNTSGWEEIVLSSATIKIGSGATPKGGKESYQNEGISFIRSMNVHDGRFEYKDLAHITDVQAKQLDNVSVKEGDVFINITGASVARSCIVPKEILPARVNQHVAIIRCDKTKLNPIFANNMFLNERFKKLLLSIGELGGATRQAITKQQLEMLTIILPPLKLQNQFADFVNQVDKSKVAVQKSLDETQLLFDSLMQKYFG